MKKMYKILLWIIDKILKFFYTETEIKEIEESFTYPKPYKEAESEN